VGKVKLEAKKPRQKISPARAICQAGQIVGTCGRLLKEREKEGGEKRKSSKTRFASSKDFLFLRMYIYWVFSHCFGKVNFFKRVRKTHSKIQFPLKRVRRRQTL
jgi:hypothetical protein